MQTGNDSPKKDLFKYARSWADECRASREVTLSWYRLGFGAAIGFNGLLVIAVLVLSQIKTLVPLIVHHYDNGLTTVEPLNDKAPKSQVQVESDIVRYVVNRESFNVTAYQYQYQLINLLSNDEVSSQYSERQNKRNPISPINTLGIQFDRSVHVYSVNFLDNDTLNHEKEQSHHNLAEVVFKITDKDRVTHLAKEQTFTAMIAWQYIGMPKNTSDRWLNWSGFEVIRYDARERNLSNN
jgi:type IV secretion system protein VirB8